MVNTYEIYKSEVGCRLKKINSYDNMDETNVSLELAIEYAAFIYNLREIAFEKLVIVAFDHSMNILGMNLMSIGDDAGCYNYNKIIATFLLLINACGFIVIHNHVSNIIEPSQDDLNNISLYNNIGNLIGIKFIDSAIVTDENINLISRGKIL